MFRKVLGAIAIVIGCVLGAAAASAIELHGHRGARGLIAENTLASFREALKHGVDCLELDVGMSKDSKIVILHDRALNPDIARRGDRWIETPLLLKDMSLQEIRQFDVGRLKPDTRYASRLKQQIAADGERIPELAELLQMPELKTAAKTCLNVEIKTSPLAPADTATPGAISDAVVKVLDRHGFRGRVKIQSFDWRNLVHLKRVAPDIALSFLTAERRWLDNVARGGPGKSAWLGGIDIDYFKGSLPDAIKHLGGAIWSPYFGDLGAGDLARAHELGLKVIVWTVNRPDDMRRMMAMGVDGIITDYPDAGRREIDAWRAGRQPAAGRSR